MSHHILIVDDDQVQQTMIAKLVSRHFGCEISNAYNGKQALFFLKKDPTIDLVLMDLGMPEMNGQETLEKIREEFGNLAVIMVTGSEELSDAVACMQLGAHDFISKPVQPERLIASIRKAYETETLIKEVKRLRRKAGEVGSFDELIGHDQGLKQVVTIAERAAPSDIPILVMGESGVGKELFARAIHHASLRQSAPFVAVNCGAIPENLVESTLFGHEKGSFTGASGKKLGKFQEADGGTLFLDEVGELPADIQVKLLRALQQKEIEPVGSASSLKVNVRILSATNRNLQQEVAEGRFREDLYFRLNGIPIEVPPLRDRKQDIPALLEHFVQHFANQQQRDIPTLTDEALAFLTSFSWKGNVRELENAVFRAIVLDTDGLISADSFRNFLNESQLFSQSPDAVIPDGYVSLYDANGEYKTMQDIEWDIIRQVLQKCDDNVVAAAKALGVGKSTLYRRIDEKKLATG